MLQLFKPQVFSRSTKHIRYVPRSYLNSRFMHVRASSSLLTNPSTTTNGSKFWIYSSLTSVSLLGFVWYEGFATNNVVRNDVAIKKGPIEIPEVKVNEEVKAKRKERRKSYYRQLCLGSIFGIAAGLLLVKISVVALYATIFALLGLEWLKSRNIITVNNSQLLNFTKAQSASLFKVGKDSISDMNIFKITFIGSMALTYCYF